MFKRIKEWRQRRRYKKQIKEMVYIPCGLGRYNDDGSYTFGKTRLLTDLFLRAQSSLFCVKEYELENYIKELREEKGLSTKQLAQVFGMSERAFSYIERGAAAPTIKLAYLIAGFFGKSVQEVFVLQRDGRTFCGEAMERKNEAP